MIALLVCLFVLCSIQINAQSRKSEKIKKTPQASRLTPEQQDLKKELNFYTDGRHFTDEEVIKLSKILGKIDFKDDWKKIKAKAEGNYPLTSSEKRIYRKMLRREEKVRGKLNKFWAKKNRPKDPNELERYKENKRKSKQWNKKKRR